MAEPYVEYDLEFHFTTGQTLYTTVREGRDAIEDTPQATKVTVKPEDGPESTLTVHRDKLNAVQSTKRIVQPTEQEELEAMAATV